MYYVYVYTTVVNCDNRSSHACLYYYQDKILSWSRRRKWASKQLKSAWHVFPHSLLHSSSVWRLALSGQTAKWRFNFVVQLVFKQTNKSVKTKYNLSLCEDEKKSILADECNWLPLFLSLFLFPPPGEIFYTCLLRFFFSFSKSALCVPCMTVVHKQIPSLWLKRRLFSPHHIHITCAGYLCLCSSWGWKDVCCFSVSELLMGEVDSSTLLSLLPTEKSRVSENPSQCCSYSPSTHFTVAGVVNT